jgi:hypothetical protein
MPWRMQFATPVMVNEEFIESMTPEKVPNFSRLK